MSNGDRWERELSEDLERRRTSFWRHGVEVVLFLGILVLVSGGITEGWHTLNLLAGTEPLDVSQWGPAYWVFVKVAMLVGIWVMVHAVRDLFSWVLFFWRGMGGSRDV